MVMEKQWSQDWLTMHARVRLAVLYDRALVAAAEGFVKGCDYDAVRCTRRHDIFTIAPA